MICDAEPLCEFGRGVTASEPGAILFVFVALVFVAFLFEVALAYLRRVGIAWSAEPSSEEVKQEYERMWQQIGARPIEANRCRIWRCRRE